MTDRQPELWTSIARTGGIATLTWWHGAFPVACADVVIGSGSFVRHQPIALNGYLMEAAGGDTWAQWLYLDKLPHG
jgi:hypothetical protein